MEKNGINKDVMSVGMAFLHETIHTKAGADWWKKTKSEKQKDQFGRFLDSGEGPGNVDNRTNGFRQELGLPTLYRRSTDTTLYMMVKGKKLKFNIPKRIHNEKSQYNFFFKICILMYDYPCNLIM